jgi:ADP-heptose:LPS heptosyltransferase
MTNSHAIARDQPAAWAQARTSQASDVRRIVVFAQSRNQLGAVLLHMPLLWSLRQHAGGSSHVSVYARCPRARLLAETGLADEVELYDSVSAGFVLGIRRRRPEILVNLHPSSARLHWAAGLSGARARVGFTSWSGRYCYTQLVPYDRTIYRGLLYLRAADRLGVPADFQGFVRHLAARQRDAVSAALRICVLPGGGAGPFKRWGIPNYLALCRELRAVHADAEVVFCVGTDDEDSKRALTEQPLPALTRILVDAPLDRLCAEIQASAVVVGNDCGPAHLALMGGARFVGLYSNEDGRVQARIDEWFLPRAGTRALTAPAGRDIRSIPVADVVAAVHALWPAPNELIKLRGWATEAQRALAPAAVVPAMP